MVEVSSTVRLTDAHQFVKNMIDNMIIKLLTICRKARESHAIKFETRTRITLAPKFFRGGCLQGRQAGAGQTAPNRDGYMTIKAPREATLTEEEICQRVRDSVLEQRLAPGTKLTEESLCGVFGVGRTTVRRAFLLLSRDNIVELHRNKGAVIASPSPDEARQVFDARRTVEAALLALAIGKTDKADIAFLRQHLAEEKDALGTADIARWIRLTGEFHLHLAKLAGNEPMLQFLEQLVFRSSLIITLYGRHGRAAHSCKGDEHTRLVDALEAGELTAAQGIMLAHLNEIEATLNFDRTSAQSDLHQIFGMARAS